ncbi:MAG: toprim domain-containing protein [Acidithiobacillus sp.]|nr:toprim domain-containing protein [Acidithiobacillus sp.]
MVNNPLVAFQEAMRAAGVFLAADVHITPDGQLHRARAADDKAGALSIWYNFHPDAPASGAAGNWRTGAKLTWCGKRLSALTASERVEIARRITEDRKRAQEATEARHAAASAKAIRIWNDSAPASPNHPYLLKKQIAPGVSRQRGDMLILSITGFDGDLRGVQTISPTGEKRFTKGMHKQGAFIRTDGMPSPDSRLIIAEGWATASTLAALSPGACVLAALDCGNMQAVAVEARRRFPLIDLVVAADSDPVGMEKAKAAAVASRAKWIWPRFPKDAPAGLSDFNDWHVWRKSQGVSHAE